jgi:hypothetical protein
MAEPSTEGAAKPLRFERTVEIDPQFAGRVTAGTLRYLLLTPSRLIRIIALSLVIAAVITLAAHTDGAVAVGVFDLGLFVIPAVYFLIFALTLSRAKKQLDDRLPVGSLYSLAMSEDTMVLKDALVTTEVSYQLYKSLQASKSLVVLNPRRGRRPTILPRELFAADSLTWLAARLGPG